MAAVTSLGLGKTMEKKLHAVGIHSAEDLKEIGSKQAVFRLKALYPNTCIVILYHLEAAIQGIDMKQLAPSRKSELKAFFERLELPVNRAPAAPISPTSQSRHLTESGRSSYRGMV